jgi:hypothetical protein
LSEHTDLSWLPVVGELVAEHLLGRPVTVRWGIEDARYPSKGRKLSGQVYFESGVCVIALDYDLPPSKAMRVLLHEIGHAKAHPEGLADHAVKGQTQADLERRGKLEDYAPRVYKQRESLADRWADLWKRWADRHCPGGDDFDKLLALTTWSPWTVSRHDRRGKLTKAFGDWYENRGGCGRSTEHHVYTAIQKLLDVDKPIVSHEDVELYRKTMLLMGCEPD